VDELRSDQIKRIQSPDYKIKDFQVDPHGKELGTNNPNDVFNKVKSTGEYYT
jgi:hypothetical protein